MQSTVSQVVSKPDETVRAGSADADSLAAVLQAALPGCTRVVLRWHDAGGRPDGTATTGVDETLTTRADTMLEAGHADGYEPDLERIEEAWWGEAGPAAIVATLAQPVAPSLRKAWINLGRRIVELHLLASSAQARAESLEKSDLALGWTPDADTVLELSAGIGDGEARYAGRGMDGSQFKRESYGLRLEKRNLGGALDGIEANMFYNQADHVMDNYSLREPNPDGPMPMAMASNVERTTTGGRIAASWKTRRVDVVAGLDAEDSRHRQRSGHGRGAYSSLPWNSDAKFSRIGVFAEGTWRLAERNQLITGLRADRADVTDKRATTGMMAMANPTAGTTRQETLAAGFVRFEQDLANVPLSWYAGIGHTERMPDYWELFSPDRGPTGAANAFAGVDTEKTTQLDIGLQYRTRRVDAWASAYAGRINDYILFSYTDGGMMGSMSSAGNIDAAIRGAELGVEYRPDEQLELGATLAYARGENRDVGGALPQMPPLEMRLSLGWDDGNHWSLGSLVRVVAAQDRVAIGQGSVVGQDLGHSPGFAIFAINGGYQFSPMAQLTFGIDNVFDRAYSEHLNLAGNADFGYPADPVRINEPGRNAWVKLNLTF